MSKALPDITFADILPPSIAHDENVQAAARAIDGELKQISRAIDTLYIYSRWDELEEPLLTHLAWQFKVDFWDSGLPVEKKRALVKNTVIRHRQKGTPSAIEEAIADVLGGGVVEEWWEYSGTPYHFRVRVDIIGQSLTEQAYAWADQLIGVYKNARSQLDGVKTCLPVDGRAWAAPYIASVNEVTLYPRNQ